MIKRILIIGGGTCSGKTTLANKIAGKENCAVFSADDHLGEYAEKGIMAGCPICRLHASMPLNSFFMRDPGAQCEELIQFYREIAPFLEEDLNQFCMKTEKEFVIAEGIAFLPEITKSLMENDNRITCRYLRDLYRMNFFENHRNVTKIQRPQGALTCMDSSQFRACRIS